MHVLEQLKNPSTVVWAGGQAPADTKTGQFKVTAESQSKMHHI